jgi:hypothetical protein
MEDAKLATRQGARLVDAAIHELDGLNPGKMVLP